MVPTDSLSLEDLALFNELFANKFGLHFPEHKREILEARLWPRLRANHLKRFIDYYLLLQYDLKRELDPLTQAITNNETYFFRETNQFEVLEGELLDGLMDGGVKGRLRALSAGCSSGEEPYSLNIFLRRALGRGESAPIRIDGIDLDATRLDQAKQGIYRPSSLRSLSPEQIKQYFIERSPTAFELRQTHRFGVDIQRGNILEPETLGTPQRYDVVFCRNVLIYFSEPALKNAINNFARVVRSGGLLFLGHSESIIGLTPLFQAERLGTSIAYRRRPHV